MCPEERRRRNIKTCCVSLEIAMADMMYFFFFLLRGSFVSVFLWRGSCVSVFLWRGSCVSFSFVFLCFFFIFLFFYKFRFKGNREKRSDYGSQNRAVEPRFERFPAFWI